MMREREIFIKKTWRFELVLQKSYYNLNITIAILGWA